MTRSPKHTRVVTNHDMHANSKELTPTNAIDMATIDGYRPWHSTMGVIPDEGQASTDMAIVPWQHSIHDCHVHNSCLVRRDSRPVKAGTSAASAHDTVGKAHTSGQ